MYFIYLYESRKIKKNVEVVLGRGEGMIKNDNGDLPNQVTLQAYVNMSQ
jgi:hypothetical protein